MRRTLGELLAATDDLPVFSPSRRAVQRKAVRAVRHLIDQRGAFCWISATSWRDLDHLRGCGGGTIAMLRQAAHQIGDAFPTEEDACQPTV